MNKMFDGEFRDLKLVRGSSGPPTASAAATKWTTTSGTPDWSINIYQRIKKYERKTNFKTFLRQIIFSFLALKLDFFLFFTGSANNKISGFIAIVRDRPRAEQRLGWELWLRAWTRPRCRRTPSWSSGGWRRGSCCSRRPRCGARSHADRKWSFPAAVEEKEAITSEWKTKSQVKKLRDAVLRGRPTFTTDPTSEGWVRIPRWLERPLRWMSESMWNSK